MLYLNISSLTNGYVDSFHQISRVLYLTPGSDIAYIRPRRDGAWGNSIYDIYIQLPFTYTGLTEKRIWIFSDSHVGYSGQAVNFSSAIQDIDDNVGSIDKVFAVGDILETGSSANYEDYLSRRAASDCPNWHEVLGNHEHNPTNSGNIDNFLSYIGVDINYTVTVDNVVFICLGADTADFNTLSPEDLTWLEGEIADNQGKNIFVLYHIAIKDTTFNSDTDYLSPSNDIQEILDGYLVVGWFHGHLHTDDLGNNDPPLKDLISVFRPLALYEYSDISEDVSSQLLGPGHHTIELADNLGIAENQKIKFCAEGVYQSKYGTFKYAQRKYGKNVSVCHHLPVQEDFISKLNGKLLKGLAVSLTISESLTRQVNFKKSLSESILINDGSIREFFLSLSDSLMLSDGAVRLFGRSFSDSIDLEEYIEIGTVELPSIKSDWKFLIKNSSGNFIASLTNARGRYLVERLNQEQEAGFILDADDDNCDSSILSLGINELHIYYRDNLKWAGQLVSARKIAKGNNVYWEVLAKDWVSLLSKRFCGVEAVREFTTIDAGQIAWTLISEAQALANGSFGITLGTIESSITRSPIYDKKNILEAIKELSNLGQDGSASYGFDFEITPTKVFNVYYPYRGEIRNDIVFRYPGNCETFEAFVDSWGIVNQEWGLGRHWTGQTAIVSRADATSQTAYKRREAIKTYRDMSVLAFLQDMVWQDIQWLKDPSTVVRFEARVDGKTDIDDYDCGDGVSVVCDKFDIDEWLWVYERKIEIEENDELKVSLVVGD